MKYVLASASPRRRELFGKIIQDFEIIVSGADENITREKPSEIVEELAQIKAAAVFEKIKDGEGALCVVGADTIVVYRDDILGKPEDEADARNMLSLLADRTHTVFTGVCLLVKREDGSIIKSTFNESTDVTFYPISRHEIDEYIATGDPMDKAGSYGIQGIFLKHIRRINGDYSSVVGLPVGRLYQKMKELGVCPGSENGGISYL